MHSRDESYDRQWTDSDLLATAGHGLGGAGAMFPMRELCAPWCSPSFWARRKGGALRFGSSRAGFCAYRSKVGLRRWLLAHSLQVRAVQRNGAGAAGVVVCSALGFGELFCSHGSCAWITAATAAIRATTPIHVCMATFFLCRRSSVSAASREFRSLGRTSYPPFRSSFMSPLSTSDSSMRAGLVP